MIGILFSRLLCMLEIFHNKKTSLPKIKVLASSNKTRGNPESPVPLMFFMLSPLCVKLTWVVTFFPFIFQVSGGELVLTCLSRSEEEPPVMPPSRISLHPRGGPPTSRQREPSQVWVPALQPTLHKWDRRILTTTSTWTGSSLDHLQWWALTAWRRMNKSTIM